MSYLGNETTEIRSSTQVQTFNGDGSETDFTLSHRVNSASDLEVFVNNVQQQPTVAYTVSSSGTTLEFTEAPSSASGNIYVIYRGFAIQQVQAFNESFTSVAGDTTPQLGGNLDVVTHDIVSTSNRNIDILPNGTGKVLLDGNGSTGGVGVSDGLIEMRSGSGSPAQIDFYCETNNQHKVSLKSPAHSDYSGNVVATLPTATGTLLNQVASSGIYLGVTSATASNLLDDYEEGTWTPVYRGSTTAGTVSAGSTEGFYTKIGNSVTIYFRLNNLTLSGASGDFNISGLPISSHQPSGGSAYSSVALAMTHNIDFTIARNQALYVAANGTDLYGIESTANSTWTGLPVTNNSGIYMNFTMTYKTA